VARTALPVLRRLAAVVLTLAVLAPLTALPVHAAEPASGAVSPDAPTVTWTGEVPLPNAVVMPCQPQFCDTFELTVDPGTEGPRDLLVELRMAGTLSFIVADLLDAAGETVASNAGYNLVGLGVTDVAAGTYTVRVQQSIPGQATVYDGLATLSDLTTAREVPASITDPVTWEADLDAPQVSAEVPLRVVFVGFEEGEFDDAAILSEVPDRQQVGVLTTYGGGFRSGDQSDLEGLDTLVNHGRAYYSDPADAPLLPIEYRWKPEIHYAPPAFADELFEVMVANSHDAQHADTTNYTQYLERYSLTRGNPARLAASGDPATAVAPGSDVMMVDAETVEDWVAQNTERHLGFPGDNSLDDPGYTFYVLNTWDSPEAQKHFPQDRYHNWFVERPDPDTDAADGIDWGRVWGGRYRFFMYDLGAAPNPYEAESWGNRRRSVDGSAAYDPPLWEYRAEMPRLVTLMHAADGMEQAITPGEFWDHEQLTYMIARSLNQAVNFRFFHAYLYEPRPGTGRFWLSDNVWHDAQAELLFPSELEKLYDQEAALTGLRTLTPYFEFEGDVVYQYLDQTAENADYVEDQAALDQAKQDGDDIAGAAHLSMNTLTMMDYIDANPDRFLRGGDCFTTVPTIQVVVPGHYAWALPIAAGIATNREGVPWGFLNSTNDVFKWSGADRDPTLAMLHPQPLGGGGFTYTTVHEASHYLGLAHPHDTVGAVRGENGEPRYYDGFTWMYNPTAAPTTYSHPEMTYNVLDQESIARGHLSYYLLWADEALIDAGNALVAGGTLAVSQLPADWQKLRSTAIAESVRAEQLFGAFDFVEATFAGQRAWQAAAALRDAALDLAPGISQFERGTRLAAGTDPATCAAGVDTEAPAPSPAPDGPVHDHGAPTEPEAPLPTTGGGAVSTALLLLGASGLGAGVLRRGRRRPAA
jgi:hypothetical protein